VYALENDMPAVPSEASAFHNEAFRNGGAGVGTDFGGVDLATDGDEVGGELFGGFGG